MLKINNTDPPPKGSKHTLIVKNDVTGLVELEIANLNGGIFIVNEADDSITGTNQAAFGSPGAIVLCAMKVGPVVGQMMKQDPRMKEIWTEASRLAEDAGLPITKIE